jgi:ribonuclease BN (tRNA processing enzyme)
VEAGRHAMSLKLQFVGCGDAFGSGGRFNTCFHLTGESTNLLIDCGASSLIALKQLGVDRNAIGAIAVTHFHADHFGGLPFFMLDAQFFSKRTEPLTIVGPPGLAKWYERVMETAFPGSTSVAPKFDFELREIRPGEVTRAGGGAIHAFQVSHGNPGGPFFAYRIEAEGRSVAYTGDTEWTDNLVGAARDVDLFVAEAYFFDKKVQLHLSLSDIEAHLTQMRPKRLVLTHMSDDMLGRLDDLPYESAEDGKVVEIG